MSSLGDVTHALPAVTDAARMGVRFDWVVEEAFQAVPAAHPAVDAVLPIALRRWRGNPWRWRAEMKSFFARLARERYDVAIDSQGLLKSALAMSRARARRKAGFSGNSVREPLAAAFYSCRVEVPKDRLAVDRQRQLFASVFGYPRDAAGGPDFGLRPGKAETMPPGDRSANQGTSPVAPLAPAGRDHPGPGRAVEADAHFSGRPPSSRRCFFLHGATWETKLYPEAMWVELARLAAASGLEVVLPWGNGGERARAERICRTGGATLLPPLGLAELMEELRLARLAVGVDSGLAHLAGALGVPTLVMYGSTSGALTGCAGSSARNLQAEFPCSPCRSRVCRYRGAEVRWRQAAVAPPCYTALEPGLVWAEALETMHADRILPV